MADVRKLFTLSAFPTIVAGDFNAKQPQPGTLNSICPNRRRLLDDAMLRGYGLRRAGAGNPDLLLTRQQLHPEHHRPGANSWTRGNAVT